MADNNEHDSAGRSTMPADGCTTDDAAEMPRNLDNVVPFDPTLSTNLMDTIETEILPRLMLLHSGSKTRAVDTLASDETIAPEMVARFVSLMLDDSVSAGHDFIDEVLQRGIGLETVYLDLLAPAARQMGKLWDDDIREFADVTIGLCRLHEILRHNSLDSSDSPMPFPTEAPSILLSTACGDQHVFGILMVAEFFRKARWHVTCEPGANTSDLVQAVSRTPYDMLGLSLSRSVSVSETAEAIRGIRNASNNKNLKVIIGGEAVERDDDILARTGADGATYDAENAPNTAMRLLANTQFG